MIFEFHSSASIGSSFRPTLDSDPRLAELRTLASSFPFVQRECLSSVLSGSDTARNRAALNIPQYFDQARTLVRSLNISDPNTHEVAANLAYGISILGADRVSQMYRDFGVVYFLRYTPQTLNESYRNLYSPNPNDSRPPLLLCGNRYDYSGAFYNSSTEFESLIRGYRITIVESENRSDLYSRMREVARRVGLIDTLFLNGHGAPDAILLGREGSNRSSPAPISDFFASSAPSVDVRLNLSDRAEIVSQLGSGVFTSNPTFVLFACSTAQGSNDIFLESNSIGIMLSESFNARLFAPTEVSFPGFNIRFDISSKIRDVSFFPGGGSVILSGIPRRTLDGL